MAHEHEHPQPPPATPPVMPEDTAGQALAETLRSSFIIIKLLMIGLVVLFLVSGMFTVGPQERAIVLRFGKPIGAGEAAVRGPGFHWAFPAPIDEVVRIPAGQILIARSTVGWYLSTPGATPGSEPPPRDTLSPGRDGYLLTSDANIVHANATLRYRITDPVRYAFAFTDTPAFITNALNNALFFAATHFSVDRILTTDVTAFRELVVARLQSLIDQYQLGIVVEQGDVEQVIPPRQERVRTAFNAVTEAELRRTKMLNDARSFENETLSRARSDAVARTNVAWAEANRLLKSVNSDAQTFVELLPQYQQNPQLFTLIRQTETLNRALTNTAERIVIPSGTGGKPRELRVLLSREPQRAVAPPPVQAKDTH